MQSNINPAQANPKTIARPSQTPRRHQCRLSNNGIHVGVIQSNYAPFSRQFASLKCSLCCRVKDLHPAGAMVNSPVQSVAKTPEQCASYI
jgi:hypothetical protein